MDLDYRAHAWVALICTVMEGICSPLYSYHYGKCVFLRKLILSYFDGKLISTISRSTHF